MEVSFEAKVYSIGAKDTRTFVLTIPRRLVKSKRVRFHGTYKVTLASIKGVV